ncbi:isocitrate lyase/phosphoenolpyruvate mutase family protein [Aeromonas caviae]
MTSGAAAPRSARASSGRYGRCNRLSVRFFPFSEATPSPLPVSADLQSGYGASPEEVGETIAAAIRAGVVGANIEDYSGNPAQALFDREHAVARVRAARSGAAP